MLVVENSLANAGNRRDVGLIPGSGISPGGEHGNPFQYSCLGNPMDRGAWQDTVHKVAKSQTRLKRPSMHWWLAGTFPTFIGHLSHTDTCALSAVNDSSLWSCAWSPTRLLGSSGLSPLRSRVSLPSKSNCNSLGLLVFLQKICRMEETSISLLPNFYLLLRRVVYITSAYHPRESDRGYTLQVHPCVFVQRILWSQQMPTPPNKILSEYNDVAEDL